MLFLILKQNYCLWEVERGEGGRKEGGEEGETEEEGGEEVNGGCTWAMGNTHS